MKPSFWILFFYELSWLLIDTASGYVLLSHGGSATGQESVGAMLRIFAFMTLVVINLKYYNINRHRFLVAAVIMGTFFSLTFIHVAQANFIGTGAVIAYYQNILRLLMPILFYFAIKIQISEGFLTLRKVKAIVYVNALVLVSNVYLTLFGIGYNQYGISEEGTFEGGTGFFSGGNEVGATIIAIFMLFLAINARKSMIKTMFFSSFFLAAAFLVLSKTSILGSLILVATFVILRTKASSFMKMLPLALSFVITVGYFLRDYIEIAINRWSYFSDTYGAVTYALGGSKRFTAISAYIDSIGMSPSLLFFGEGWNGICENGFFDLLQGFGILGMMIYVVWFYWFFLNARLGLKYRSVQLRLIAVGFFLILGVSYFAGHVVQSSMLGPFAALLANYWLLLTEDDLSLKREPSPAGAVTETAKA